MFEHSRRKQHRVSVKRIALSMGALFLVFTVLLQVGMYRQHRFGNVHIGGLSASLLRQTDVQDYLAALGSDITFRAGDKKVAYHSQYLGTSVDVDATLANIHGLRTFEQFVPFWGMYRLLQPQTADIVYATDTQKLHTSAAEVAKALSYQPQDARFTVQNGDLVVVPESAGATVDSTQVVTAFELHNIPADQPVSIDAVRVEPSVTVAQLEPAAATYRAIQKTDLVVHIDGKVFTPSKEQLLSLVSLDPTAGADALKIKSQAIAEMVADWSKEVSVVAGVTQVSYYDDVEASRVVGRNGKALDVDEVSTAVLNWMQKPITNPIELSTYTVYPRVAKTYTYSHSSAQLQAKLDAWVAKTPGVYRIAVRELGGRGREASVNAQSRTVMASTYKIFLAYVAYRMAENAELSLDSSLIGNTTISQCIEPMIVDSDNECAVALGKKIGWAYAEEVIANAGFVGVKMNNYDANGVLVDDKLVSGEQEARFLMQLSAGTLMNQPHTNELLGYMKRQVYREGIPAGSNGAVVADKVGFLWGYYYHDVGIVYGENSTYALVIMTEQSGWGYIREAAQAVYDFMNSPEE